MLGEYSIATELRTYGSIEPLPWDLLIEDRDDVATDANATGLKGKKRPAPPVMFLLHNDWTVTVL